MQQVKLDRKRFLSTLFIVVRALHHHLILRSATVALLLVSWLLFTNHCALGMMQRPAPSVDQADHCCGKSDHRNTQPEQPGDCCKIKATPTAAKTDAPAATFQLQFEDYVIQVLVPPVGQPIPDFLFDHGPPRAVSFAEAVLQRSLLGHAPPAIV